MLTKLIPMKSKRLYLNYSTLTVIGLCFFLFIFSGFTTFNSDNDGVIVVKIDQLDPYEYGDIYKAFEGNSEVKLTEACVPAEIIKFERVDGVELEESVLFDHIKVIIQDNIETESIEMMDYDSSDFQEKCLDARLGK